MKENIVVSGVDIWFTIEKYFVHIVADNAFVALITNEPEAATNEIVKLAKAKYHNVYNNDFKVSDSSMFIEIIGHVYTDKLAIFMNKILPFKFMDKLAAMVEKRCAIINIGERGRDRNRIVWDVLSPFKTSIIRLLKIKNHKKKT